MRWSKENIWNEDNKTLVEVDERVFSICVEHQLQVIREAAKEMILLVAPDYKQRNAALGLLTQEEADDIKIKIQNIRTMSNQKEAQILAVVWDGTEANRVAACDAVQNVRW
jgi:hypothetical protein